MEIRIFKNDNDVYLVELAGSLDLYSSNQLKKLVMKMIENRAERCIINLGKVDKINSSGIGALIYVCSTLKKLKCPMSILATGGPVLHALEVTGLKNYFPVFRSLKEALGANGA